MRVCVTGVFLLALLAAAPAGAGGRAGAGQAGDTPPCAACVGLVITPGQALALPPGLGGLTVLVDAGPHVDAGRQHPAKESLDDIARRGGRPGLWIEGVPDAPLPAALVRAARTIVLDLHGADASEAPEALAYTLKTHLTAIRASSDRAVELGIAGPSALLDALLARDLASYTDFLVWPSVPSSNGAAPQRWRTMGGGVPVLTSVAAALQATREQGTEHWLWRLPRSVDDVARIAAELARAAEWLTPGLVAPSHVEVRCGAARAETFLNPVTLDTIALARCGPGDAVTVVPAEAGVERLTLADGGALFRVPAPDASDRFAAGVDVVGARDLRVEEIIARHQAAAARQAAFIRSLISRGTSTLSFEAPGFPAPVTISAETIIYADRGRTELEQRRILVNGIAFSGRGVPRLPIIEAERVASPPLTITLGDVYRYRLTGQGQVGRTRCFVVDFRPVDPDALLFSGRAWIAVDGYAMVKVEAAQTGLRGAIVSSEQTDEYREHQPGIWLLERSDVRQMYEGAAHRTPIHRVLTLTSHEINEEDFEQRLHVAYASDSVMLRDTAEGFRYLKRPSEQKNVQGPGPCEACVVPVVADRAERVRTLAAGVIIDPNISTPLPFAGLSYVDFNLLGTGAQLNAFFGGSYGQLAFSVPSLGGTRWQLAGRAFGIASSYNDRAFSAGREIYAENIRQRPAHASVWLLRPLTPRISIRAGYDLDYTHFARSDTTGASFAVPAAQIVHGARFAIDGQRAGWNASVWWNPAVRSGWREWGTAGTGDYNAGHRTFQRYGLTAARSAVLTPRLAGRLEGAWMAGRDLDRFSRYAFGTFDNRLRGYPSALIRFDRGGVARAALAWSAGPLLRLDAFLDSAMVRDFGYGRGFRNYTGVGAAAEGPAPFGLLVAAEWGYGIRGVNASGRTGTHVIRISAFKIF